MRLFVHRQPTYGRWTDGSRLSDRLLLTSEERKKGKELIITMAESMSRGGALTFSSLCLATIKKKKKKNVSRQWGMVVCVRARAHVAACAFVCVRKTQEVVT